MAKIVIIGSHAISLIDFRGNLIQELIENGHEVIACAPDAPEYIRDELTKYGAKYFNINLERTGMNPFLDLTLIIKLAKFLKFVKPDVVLTYTIKPNIYGSFCSILCRVPTIGVMITGLGHPFSDKAGILLKFISISLYRLVITKRHVIFFQNKDDMKTFIDYNIVDKRYKIEILNGSGVDINKYTPKELPSEVSFLLIARLIKEKGVREYAEAAKIIKDKYPDVRFRLVGPIEDDRFYIPREELDRWTEEGLIEYLGVLKNVRQVIGETFVYVLPSYREGTPRSVLEALAMSRPVITTDVPGCRETVVDGLNGFLVPKGDAKALAIAMEKIILQPSIAHKMGVASRRIAEEKFDVRQVNKVILASLGLFSKSPDDN